MLHDPSGAALMRLAAEGIALHEPPLAPPPFQRDANGVCTPAALPGTLSTFKGRGAARPQIQGHFFQQQWALSSASEASKLSWRILGCWLSYPLGNHGR